MKLKLRMGGALPPLTQWHTHCCTRCINQPEHDADHQHASSLEVKNPPYDFMTGGCKACLMTSVDPFVYVVVCLLSVVDLRDAGYTNGCMYKLCEL